MSNQKQSKSLRKAMEGGQLATISAIAESSTVYGVDVISEDEYRIMVRLYLAIVTEFDAMEKYFAEECIQPDSSGFKAVTRVLQNSRNLRELMCTFVPQAESLFKKLSKQKKKKVK